MEHREFKLHAPFSPTGDQPEAIEKLTEGVLDGIRTQVLVGVTGSGKTFTMANVIKNVGRPTLVIANFSPKTPSNISSPTTTTISPRVTSPPPIPTSRRTSR